jgi:hypothetical protein
MEYISYCEISDNGILSHLFYNVKALAWQTAAFRYSAPCTAFFAGFHALQECRKWHSKKSSTVL